MTSYDKLFLQGSLRAAKPDEYVANLKRDLDRSEITPIKVVARKPRKTSKRR